ncbi:MAG: GNAT family N-acetyltransferase [Bacteroidales bacterium]|nr:GNAT family N-acetyltransferase [Bacteroidales bacterium]
MINTEFTKVEYCEIEALRLEYLNSLAEFQDLYLELLIADSEYFTIALDKTIGYAIVTPDNTLIEFFICKEFSDKSGECFNDLLSRQTIKQVLCKTFDYQLLNNCLLNHFSYSVQGFLYRELKENDKLRVADLSFRYARLTDLPYLTLQEDEVFEPKELLEDNIKNNEVIICERDNVVIGCGFISQVVSDFKYYDLGVWVDSDFRRNGYAVRIMLYLKSLCLKNGWIPVCGCSSDNIASQKMLSKVGFISNHKLLEFNCLVSK